VEGLAGPSRVTSFSTRNQFIVSKRAQPLPFATQVASVKRLCLFPPDFQTRSAMRLQRLEIAGFKSFPDRSELTFDTGVTAIVGPNGCGKSNVVDALTWVLGEQSAKSLRGDRMEDVIFGGSDARRPTSAAEVRLKLSGVAARVPGNGRTTPSPGRRGANGHGARVLTAGGALPESPAASGDLVALLEEESPLIVRDVELMRRLYRSGESEYLIDGEVCRLRDVQDLLMDAGLGVKGYAVIEQGKIGQILSARPTDRRQLIEEAAGVTKYKSRRRAAELKLEAARQNLTRVDDIVFEVEKQRGTLKRQAAKARRYRRLREELRRWEKVQFAERYRALGAGIEASRMRLADARDREAAAATARAVLEDTLETLRREVDHADAAAGSAREVAHARELAIGRLQQQVAFDRQQVETLSTAVGEIEAEIAALASRREPAQRELQARIDAAGRASEDREAAAGALAGEEQAYADAAARIEGLEGDVEAARSEVFAAVNASTALRHAMEHAAAARVRIGEALAKLDVEAHDLTVEAERASGDRSAADAALARARESADALRIDRARYESALDTARRAREARTHELRAGEQQLAAVDARLRSLEELDAARAEYGDGARLVLAESNGEVGQLGSVADYLEVDRGYERAVEACLGDLLQHVVVPSHDAAQAGLRFASERSAGRVGFLVAGAAPPEGGAPDAPSGLTAMTGLVTVSGPAAAAIRAAIAHAWVAESSDVARQAADALPGAVATLEGVVFRGPHRVEGGARREARGILTTKREIKELRERLEAERAIVSRLRDEVAALDAAIAAAGAALTAVQGQLHDDEKAIVGYELQSRTAAETADRIARKQDQITIERRTAAEELRLQEARQAEARDAIARLEIEQRSADERLTGAQRRLFEAREAMQDQARRTAEAKASHAALMERAAALATDVERLQDAARDLDARVESRSDELSRATLRRESLQEAIAAAEAQLATDVAVFEDLRQHVRDADERCQALRASFEEQDTRLREARRALDAIRAEVAELDVARATAEADLSHLAASCQETVQASLDEVSAEVDELARNGLLASPRPVDDAPEPAEIDEEGGAPPETEGAEPTADTQALAPAPPLMTADEMVADLRMKIERMGPVNMMAIDQFDDLESRHTFLTAQRTDLVDSIAATGEAIRRIDKTTRERFNDAFTVINDNFERTFQTLFGGGRAGLVLLDASDALESGIDIIAQPPGKRLQSVQLLSGGEKALTAMALMFAIFEYRPSPFCLLDEIDAPLDDANIGRFVEMLQGMQDHTQFILITHNRKTMEIADRLYGVTMEEPGVSKLISVQLN
jgi:chromosome segregation protein